MSRLQVYLMGFQSCLLTYSAEFTQPLLLLFWGTPLPVRRTSYKHPPEGPCQRPEVQRNVHLRQRRALRRHRLLLLHGGDQRERRRHVPLDAQGPLLGDVRVQARGGAGMDGFVSSLESIVHCPCIPLFRPTNRRISLAMCTDMYEKTGALVA